MVVVQVQGAPYSHLFCSFFPRQSKRRVFPVLVGPGMIMV